MIGDCHTHLWTAKQRAEEIAKEAWINTKSKSRLDIGEEEHWEATQPVYKSYETHGIPLMVHQGTTFVRRAR